MKTTVVKNSENATVNPNRINQIVMEKPKKSKLRLRRTDRCFVCFEKITNPKYLTECDSEISENILDTFSIRTDLLCRLQKKICFVCKRIAYYFANYKKVTISNITEAENTVADEEITYHRPLIFDWFKKKILSEANLTDMESDKTENLIVFSSYQDGEDYKKELDTFKPQLFQCRYCTSTFTKKTALTMHERYHERKQRRERRRSMRSLSTSKEREYVCDRCDGDEDVIFKSQLQRNQHIKLVHTNEYQCRFCNKEKFENELTRSWHEAVCVAQINDDDSPGPRTRSRSRLRFSSNEDGRPVSPVSSIASSKKIPHNSRDKTRRSTAVSTAAPKIKYSELFRPVSPSSTKINKRSKKYKIRENIQESAQCPSEYSQESNHGKTQFDDFRTYEKSVPYRTVRSSIPSLPEHFEYSETPSSVRERIEILRRKSKARETVKSADIFKCNEKLCSYTARDLDDVVKHEIKSHGKQAWYSCNGCSKSFTQSAYLEYHKNNVHFFGPKVCHICGEVFDDEVTFKLHIDRHNRYYIPCDGCDLKFVSEISHQRHFLHYAEYDEKHACKQKLVRRKICRLPNVTGSDMEETSAFESDDLCTVEKESEFDIIDVKSLSCSSSRASTPYHFSDTEYEDEDECDDKENVDIYTNPDDFMVIEIN